MRNITYSAAKETAKGVRVWFEGSALDRSGFPIGTSYRVQYLAHKQSIIVTADPAGPRKISGQKRPILDLQNSTVSELYADGERVQAVFMDGQIVIQRHHEETSQEQRERQYIKRRAAGELVEASMFTGGGVSTEAIHQAAGGRLAWIAELEHKYIESAADNCLAVDDNTVLIEGPVEGIESRYFTDCDVLSFSMPCAGHSKAGKAKHKSSAIDHSGLTLFPVVRAIQSSNPAVIISENVVEAQDSAIYELLRLELDRLGYTVFEQVLDSSHTGSLENRRRYWLIAFSNGIAPESFELPTVPETGRTLASIMVDAPDRWKDYSYLADKAERDAAAGKGFKRQLLTGEETRCGTIGRFYAKARSTEPFFTRADGKSRLFTPEEHAHVKSAPVHLIAGQSATTAHEILGQSVDYLQPYKLMRAILAA